MARLQGLPDARKQQRLIHVDLVKERVGREPIIVDAAVPAIVREVAARLEFEHVFQQFRELLLPGGRHQEIPERAKAFALIGTGNGVALREDLLQQRALAALPRSDALADRAIQRAEVLLYLAEIAQQAARRGCHLQEAVLHLRIVEQREMARAN